ncbi:MAG: hypothetical protein HZA54_01465 [Planctomycetes bacterium]|nr:hypothetical protein [Planctomycetota bacterium]
MPHDLTDPTTVALLAAEAFTARSIRYALYGGLALAAYGEPRETRDADLAVFRDAVPGAQAALEALGLTTACNFTDVRFGGLQISRFAVLGGANAAGVNVIDLVVPRSDRYAAGVLDRALRAPLRGVEIALVSPEDFLLLKVLSTRERDLEDAATVLRRMGAVLDRGFLEREAATLATELPDASVAARFAALQQHRT